MDANKENINSSQRKPATRIPVPVEPLPLLPKHLITKVKEREHLKTLQSSNHSVPSTSKAQVSKIQEKSKSITKKVAVKCDLTHITKRTKNVNDWTQNVFHDPDESLVRKMVSQNNIKLPGPSKKQDKLKKIQLNETSIHNKAFLLLSDDDEEEEKVELIVKAAKNIGLGLCKPVIVTPVVPIVHKAVKNVKKSLKRPHSRELLGVLTPVKQAKAVEDKAKRRLLPYLEEALRTPDHWKRVYMTNQSYVGEILDYLLKSEQITLSVPNVANDFRIIVINWLLKMNGASGNPAVIQTACWYFDSILVKSLVTPHKLQVVAAACFWIAQKIHGPMVSARKLAACAKDNFTVKCLLNMEWRVLNELNFPKQPIVAQDFIPYLAWWCDSAHPGEIEVAATFICMCGTLACKTLCQQHPSVIAVAAVDNALRLLKKTDLIARLESCRIYAVASEKEKDQQSTNVTTLLRRSVIIVNSLKNKTLIDQYNLPPSYIAKKITTAATMLPDVLA